MFPDPADTIRHDNSTTWWISKHWLLRIGWLLTGWYWWTRWGVSGTGVGRTDVSRRQNGRATMGAGTGAPPLDLEGRRAMRSGRWYQLCQCCKDAEYLCRRSKIIQIECTEIRTSNVVQDSIKSTYNTIVVWLHTTINRTSNVNVPKNKLQKNFDTNISKYWRFHPLQSGIGGTTVLISKFLQTFTGRNCWGKYSFNVNIWEM